MTECTKDIKIIIYIANSSPTISLCYKRIFQHHIKV